MSTPIDDGGPAYPADVSGLKMSQATRDKMFEYSGPMPGMSLRDYFAGQALGHIPALLDASDENASGWNIAKHAYQIADAMLAASRGGPQS